MGTLLLATFVASLLGSFHCACMCGPIAIWSSGTIGPGGKGVPLRPVELTQRIGGYHVGRLITYLTLGLIAGLAGKAIGSVGEGAGIQAAAARVAGLLMIAIGAWRFRSLWPSRPGSASTGMVIQLSNRLAKAIASLRPHLARLPVTARSIGLGAVTVLLPCGWLYLFVLFAGGSGSILSSLGVMFAFWLGTIPSLVALVTGLLHLQNASRQRSLPRFMPMVGAMVLILFGAHTATGRASADLRQLERRLGSMMVNPMIERSAILETIQEQPLPCCQHAK